ncbi:MAG: CAP domain-containing protein [archaeon]
MAQKISCKKVEGLIHKYVNISRKKRRLGTLKSNWGLKSLTRSHSCRMAKRKKIWHGDGVFQAKNSISYPKGLWGFILSIFAPHSGYSGENVAMLPLGRVKGIRGSIRNNKDVAKAFHGMWMKSPGHKRNILNSKFSLIGVGIKKKGRYFYATQVFYG